MAFELYRFLLELHIDVDSGESFIRVLLYIGVKAATDSIYIKSPERSVRVVMKFYTRQIYPKKNVTSILSEKLGNMNRQR